MIVTPGLDEISARGVAQRLWARVAGRAGPALRVVASRRIRAVYGPGRGSPKLRRRPHDGGRQRAGHLRIIATRGFIEAVGKRQAHHRFT